MAFGWGEALQSIGQDISGIGKEAKEKKWQDVQKEKERKDKMQMEFIKMRNKKMEVLYKYANDPKNMPEDRARAFTLGNQEMATLEQMMGVQTTIPSGPTAGTTTPSPTAGVQGPVATQGMPTEQGPGLSFETPPEEQKPLKPSEANLQGKYEQIALNLERGFTSEVNELGWIRMGKISVVDYAKDQGISEREAAIRAVGLGRVPTDHPYMEQIVMPIINRAYPEEGSPAAIDKAVEADWQVYVTKQGGKDKLWKKVQKTGKFVSYEEYEEYLKGKKRLEMTGK